MRRTAAVCAAVALTITATAGTARANSGAPDGEGANTCHLLYEGGPAADSIQLGGTKYNVGNPEQVLIAGDCDGGPIAIVDDGLTLDMSSPSGSWATQSWDFYNFCGGSNNGGQALDVTSLFSPGTNAFELTLDNDCGGFVYAPALYLVVQQHTD